MTGDKIISADQMDKLLKLLVEESNYLIPDGYKPHGQILDLINQLKDLDRTVPNLGARDFTIETSYFNNDNGGLIKWQSWENALASFTYSCNVEIQGDVNDKNN